MPSLIRPANNARHLDFFKDEALILPGYWLQSAIGVADIDTTVRTSWPVRFRSRIKGRADKSGLVIPQGAVLSAIGIRVVAPSDEVNQKIHPGQTIACTSGDRFKLGTAVGATGTQAFNASASTAYVASTAFGSNSVTSEQRIYAVPPNGTSAALSGATTLTLYNDNGTTGAGSGVSVSTGTLPVVVMAHWYLAPDVPYVDDFLGRYVAP